MNMPLVSVLMPVYNAEAFVKEAIASILDQSYQNFEFIIINDGSTDSSEGQIISFKTDKIKYYKNETNLGLIATLNKGIDLCKGEYIVRMDADDLSLRDRIKKQVEFMESNKGVGVCGCDYIHFGKGKQIPLKSHHTHDLISGWMLFNSSVVHPALIIRSSVLKSEKTYFNSEFKHVEDYELWSRLLFKSQFADIPETLLKYRIHASQVSLKFRGEQIENGNKVRKRLLEKIGFKFSEREFRVHCLLGNSQIISSLNDLAALSVWFDELYDQNQKLKFIPEATLQNILAKQWYDACGITNLGTKAFFFYFKSHWHNNYPGSKAMLLSKCIVRWVR
ncbi:MAG TPA: glycosyltransferase family 2 protein [Bacteroidia bacterium]|jgi:glycosyltransferase involved in cell wall biosynthesis|nr:glycosyltransferase family 2 protein [Bacteroidia bacterium]